MGRVELDSTSPLFGAITYLSIDILKIRYDSAGVCILDYFSPLTPKTTNLGKTVKYSDVRKQQRLVM